MYEGNPVDLQMEKIISADGIFDDNTRKCRVHKYDLDEDYIYLDKRRRSDGDFSGRQVQMLYLHKNRAALLYWCCKRKIPL